MIPAIILAVTALLTVSLLAYLALRLSRDWLTVLTAYLEAKAAQRPMVLPDPPDIGPPKFYRPIIKDPPEDEEYS
jgi:hypothetical protein